MTERDIFEKWFDEVYGQKLKTMMTFEDVDPDYEVEDEEDNKI